MARVDWITWKTNTNEIINPDKIIEIISDKFQNYTSYMNSVVYEGIDSEIENGGLDQLSLNVMGNSPANEKAIAILNSINEIENIIETLKNQIYNATLEQKKIEKQQLINELEEKIKSEEKILNNTLSVKEKLSNSNSIISDKKVTDMIDISTERLNKLKERLELAKSI